MSRNGKVIVAMSGGVDSSVAATLLKEQGYDCVGVFMRVGASHDEPTETCRVPSEEGSGFGVQGSAEKPRRLRHGCCSATDAIDARAVAGRLGIPFYALNFQDDFDRIIEYFVDEYAQARTPNPCVMCNIHLKFGKLLRYAEMMDAEFVATGHYARTVRTGEFGGGTLLARAANRAKDQSYVLFGIRREDLPRCLFPIGGIADKADVRRMAGELGLRVHDKPDSQEICFVPNNDYRQLLARRRPELLSEGAMVDTAGREVARHAGVAAYTIGQRRGLGVALGKPVYVTNLNVLTNTVTIGERDELFSDGLFAERVNWLIDPAAVETASEMPVEVKIRHMHMPGPARLSVLGDSSVEVRFHQPQTAVTPGQAAVFYSGDIVLGGGWIRGPAGPKNPLDS